MFIKCGSTWLADNFYLPVFSFSAEEIFKNELALFDVNFFNPMNQYGRVEERTYVKTIYNKAELIPETERYVGGMDDFIRSKDGSVFSANNAVFNKTGKGFGTEILKIYDEINQSITNEFNFLNYDYKTTNFKVEIDYDGWNGDVGKDATYIHDLIIYYKNGDTVDMSSEGSTEGWTKIIRIRYKSIYQGSGNYKFYLEAVALNDFHVAKIDHNAFGITQESTAQVLRDNVSSWYYTLRNLALLVLMLILIYSGIRIVIGSTAGEKAKYKERLMDWLVAMCLIFIMHYIMSFSVTLVSQLIDLINVGTDANINTHYIPLTTPQYNSFESLEKKGVWEEYGGRDELLTDDSEAQSGKALLWSTNLIGDFRLKSQLVGKGTAEWVGYSFCYLILILFTIFFAFTYVRRVVYMAFLTMVAPLVAMTYPIDKMTDGKAQAFNTWLKEYIFNLMIQPLHLLLYTILVSSAYLLATENPIYALVAIGFIMPAEKLMRKFFGFEKAQTPGALGGAAGAALAMSGLQSLMKGGSRRHKGSKGNDEEKGSKEEGDSSKIKFSDDKNRKDNGASLSDGGISGLKTNKFGKSGNAAGLASGLGQKAGSNAGKVAGTTAGKSVGKAAKSQNGQGRFAKSKIGGLAKNGARSIKGASKAYAKGMGKKVYNRLKNGKPIKSLARGVAGLYGGALLGTAGLALGIASGDPSKALQYTTAGAAGGYMAGKGLADNTMDAFSVNEKQYKEDYQNYMDEQEQEEQLMSEENIEAVMNSRGCSREEAEEFLDTTGRECRDSGVENVEDWMAIDKVVNSKNNQEGENEKITLEEAIIANKMNNSLPEKITPDREQGYQDKFAKMYTKRLKQANPLWSDEDINARAQAEASKTIRLMSKLEDEKDALTKK